MVDHDLSSSTQELAQDDGLANTIHKFTVMPWGQEWYRIVGTKEKHIDKRKKEGKGYYFIIIIIKH
jgi:hypothetical protein